MTNLAFKLQEDNPLREDQGPRREYRMIESFEIENFRCFKKMSLEELRTINIVAGDNGSGKTALLEAIFLAAHAHPRAVTMMRQIRNYPLPQGQVYWDRSRFQSLWSDLFHDFSHSAVISAKFKDSFRGDFVFGMACVDPEKTPAFSSIEPIPELMLYRKGVDGLESQASLKIDQQGNPITEGFADMVPAVYILPAASQFFHEDMVGFFSGTSRENEERVILKAMRQVFPQVTDIEVLVEAGVQGLWVKTTNTPNRKQPLGTVSAGVARYFNILLAIASRSKGVVLVDEIENGLYWERMPTIWKRLREFCKKREVQLFATTHSYECLRSLIGAMENHESDFSLIRTEAKDSGHEVRQFDGKSFLAALKQHGEVR